MTQETIIGFIGCGNISDTYIAAAIRSKLVRVKAVADLNPQAAERQSAKYGVAATSIEALLADPEIEIVVNLTVPGAHFAVGKAILDAGKHVYGEKPLTTSFADGVALVEYARERGLSVGCAPDTFMGGGHQAVRRALDEGRIGKVVGGSATIMHRGMEHWHPNPTFFYKQGGGPVLDLAVYYVTQLLNLLGPVASVTSNATIGLPQRRIATGELAGTLIDVEVPTMVNGVLEFACGANVSLSASWEVHRHGRHPIELYGSEGSIINPDPDLFGGEPMLALPGGDWTALPISDFPFHANNGTSSKGLPMADYRIVGLLDMAVALKTGRPYRASAELSLHVLEVLEGLMRSSVERRHIEMTTRCERPAPLPFGVSEEVFLAEAVAAASALEAAK